MVVRSWFVILAPTLLACLSGSGSPQPLTDAAAPLDASEDAESGGRDAGSEAGPSLDDFEPTQDAALPYRCDLGITRPDGEEAFAAHDSGEVIPIAGIGQAGLTARPAVRMYDSRGEPVAIDEAVVELVLTNLSSGVIAESRPFDRPVALDCRSDGACYRGPVLVEISHLAKLTELEGLLVGVDVRVVTTTGEALCHTLDHGVLDRV